MRKVILFLAVFSCSVALVLAGSKKIQKPVVLDDRVSVQQTKLVGPPSLPPPPPQNSVVGTYTGLQGFYDYQSNGGASQQIRVNPANQKLHAVYMVDPDSPIVPSVNPNRGTVYAHSTNGGATWDNFNNLRVPTRRSGFMTLDLGQGAIAGAAIISNHSIIAGAGNQATIFIDFPEGGGAFAEIAPPVGFGSDEPIWPYVTGASDGSVVMASSRQTAATNHYSRTVDFVSWSALGNWPGVNDVGGRYPTHANGTGRVGIFLQAVDAGSFFLESTDNGGTWSSTATEIHPGATPGRIAGVDTFQCWVGGDFVYNGNTPLFVVDELNIGANVATFAPQIAFYSTATGWKAIATPVNTPNVPPTRNVAQTNHFEINYPVIGMSGTTIVVAYVAMQRETSVVGSFNYCDIFAVKSTNGGNTWSTPYNVTQTPALDERYPSISQWNEAGFANVTWQEDTQPGSAAFTDNAPLSRARQKFLKLNLSLLLYTGVGERGNELATGFKLAQNFPNPFNPATKIDYTIARAGLATIRVFDILGKEVASLLNEELQPGSYQVTFDGRDLASGIYVYKMTANGFAETRKMMLVK